MSRFINAELKSYSKSGLEAQSKSDTDLMVKLEPNSGFEK